jgi:hypothetical protein
MKLLQNNKIQGLKFMKTTIKEPMKTVRLHLQTHKDLKKISAELDVDIQDVVDAFLEYGIRHSEKIKVVKNQFIDRVKK